MTHATIWFKTNLAKILLTTCTLLIVISVSMLFAQKSISESTFNSIAVILTSQLVLGGVGYLTCLVNKEKKFMLTYLLCLFVLNITNFIFALQGTTPYYSMLALFLGIWIVGEASFMTIFIRYSQEK